jgi:diguanylate cyclase (GGDEF)-like protein
MLIVTVSALLRINFVSFLLEHSIHEYAIEQQLTLTRHAAQEIDDELLLRKNLLLTLAHEFPVPLIQKPQALVAWLAKRHIQSPIFSLGLVFIKADGKGALADFPPLEGRRQLDFSGRDWFLAARDKGDFAVGKPVLDDAGAEAALHLAVPVKNGAGQVIGVLMGGTPLSQHNFLEPLASNSYGRSSQFLLVSPRDQIVVMDSVRELALKPAPLPGAEPLYDRALKGWRGSEVTGTNLGVERWETYVSVPTANWLLVGRLSSSEVLLGIRKSMAVLPWINLLAISISIFFIVWLLGSLLKPLRSMTHQMHLMAAGEIPIQKLLVVRQDEVGSLIDSFNALVDQLQKTQERLQHLAHHDVLTQLPNRRMFIEDLAHSCALALRQSSALALLFIDLDGFKRINDQYGHAVGDLLLKQVADRLNEGVRKSDRVARLGGDEFVVVLMDCKGRENLVALAGKWIARLSKPYSVNGQELRIGASIGIGVFPDHAGDADTLVAKADAAMYEAKRAGANTYRFVGDQV